MSRKNLQCSFLIPNFRQHILKNNAALSLAPMPKKLKFLVEQVNVTAVYFFQIFNMASFRILIIKVMYKFIDLTLMQQLYTN